MTALSRPLRGLVTRFHPASKGARAYLRRLLPWLWRVVMYSLPVLALSATDLPLRSGELHSARIPREYWQHRLQMAKALGFNTVSTYVFWSQHEPEPGKFDWSGQNDIAEFCRQAQREGLQVLIRPGPYVCAEYDLGGMPWWLLRQRELRLRGRDPEFLKAVRGYYRALGEQLAPLQVTRGGPIAMVQVENEYDGYGRDAGYIEVLAAALRESGFDVPLYTSEMSGSLRPSNVPGLVRGVGFSRDPDQHFADLRRIQPTGPLFCSELYTGWYDVWGRGSRTAGPFETLTNTVERVLQLGGSFNLYMLHGGTSFGFTAGANDEPYRPQPTSYDYGAPIDEGGSPTPKFFALREVMARRLPRGQSLPPIPPLPRRMELPPVRFTESVPLVKGLPTARRDGRPRPMELLGQGQGCVLYRTILQPGRAARLILTEPHDFVVVMLDGQPVGTLDRMRRETSLWIPARGTDTTLDLLVEAMGHVNYGPNMARDRKGITERVELDDGRGPRELLDWEMFPMPLTASSIADLRFEKGIPTPPPSAYPERDVLQREPTFFRATFDLKEIGDTFLDLRTWSKGVVWVNGHNLGRYWSIGPQQTLYLPGPWLKSRGNEIVVLDLMGPSKAEIAGRTAPILNELNLASARRLHRRPGQQLKLEGVKPVKEGQFASDTQWQQVKLEPRPVRYVCLEAVTSLANDGYSTCAELDVVDASGASLPRAEWRIVYADSEELFGDDGTADRALDGQPDTFWHSRWDGTKDPLPHQLVLDLGHEYEVGEVRYLARQDRDHGRIGQFRVYTSRVPFGGL